MKKISYLLILLIVIPAISFASFNDLTLESGAIINAGGYDLNIHGLQAVVQSIVVDTNSFDVTLLSSSTFSVSSSIVSGFNVSNTGASVTSTITCGNPSILTLSTSGTSTVTVTPVSSCTATRTHSSSGSYARPLALITTPTVIPTTTIPFEGCDNRNTGFSTKTGQSCINNKTTNMITTFITPVNLTLTRTLKYKMTGEDVKNLQRYLNTNNYPVSQKGAGSLNNETNYLGLKTKAAIIKFQLANKLMGDGIVGPITKSKF